MEINNKLNWWFQRDRKNTTGISDDFQNKFMWLEEKSLNAIHLYRLISLILASLFFILTFDQPAFFKAILVGALCLITVAAFFLYSKFWGNLKPVALIVLTEIIAITLVITFTGGFDSPFLWYSLNSFIIAAVHFSFFSIWLCLAVFYICIILEKMYFTPGFTVTFDFILNRLNSSFVLILIILAAQVFGHLFVTLREQSHKFQEQQHELISAYNHLTQNHHIINALTNFQREIVSFKKQEDIFLKLVKAGEFIFPFLKTAVLVLNEPVPPKSLSKHQGLKIISKSSGDGELIDPHTIGEIKDHWQKLYTAKMIVGREQNWVALPLKTINNKVMALFVGWLRPSANINQFSDTLPLFLSFTEQVIQLRYSLKQTENSLQHLSSLYEAVETISSRGDIKEVADLFAAYVKALTGCSKVIFWIERLNPRDPNKDHRFIYTVKGKRDIFPEEYWHENLLRIWSEIKKNPAPMREFIEDSSGKILGQIICVPVNSRSQNFGMLAGIHPRDSYNTDEIIQTLSFLADLSAISIERSAAEIFSDRLIIIEEQNRIASEIHDTISQNLFSIVYGAEALLKQSKFLPGDFQKKLYNIRNLSARTAKDLRALIYRLSPRHRGDDTFITEFNSYLSGLASLNQISVDINVSGREEFINPAIQKVFYRIMKEATGNAVRHGECDRINIELEMTPFSSTLEITDNGKGFDVKKYTSLDKRSKKLGLTNMRELALSIGGTLKIESEEGEGTVVTCHVPTSPVSRGKVPSA